MDFSEQPADTEQNASRVASAAPGGAP